MHRSTRRLIGLAVGLILFLVGSALLYQEGMARLEGTHRTFWDSIEWAGETLSTTGYGYDSHWHHPAMVVLVVVVQFAGVFLVFLVVPVFLVPFLEERFERRVPRIAPKMANHVVVYRYGPTVETLLQRLKTHDVPSIVVETDEANARAVQERQLPVVFSRAEEDALDICRLAQARALVANGRDEENAALILRARQMGFRGEIFAFVEEPAHRKPMELAGATAAYTPRHIVAAALAAHASDRISPRLPGSEDLPSVERREIRVAAASPLAGLTLAASNLGAASGAIVVGQWIRNRLHARCDASMIIEPGSILEIAGDAASLDRAAAMIGSRFLRRSGPYLIAGFGEVGRKVHELLCDAGEEVRVVEREAIDGVDIVGNVLDPSVLERAALPECRAIVLALNSDDATPLRHRHRPRRRLRRAGDRPRQPFAQHREHLSRRRRLRPLYQRHLRRDAFRAPPRPRGPVPRRTSSGPARGRQRPPPASRPAATAAWLFTPGPQTGRRVSLDHRRNVRRAG